MGTEPTDPVPTGARSTDPTPTDADPADVASADVAGGGARRRWRPVATVLAVLVVALLAALGGDVGSGVDRGSVDDAPLAAAPTEGSVLVEGGWPEVAAYVRASVEQGEATVVNLFASWCAPCREELPLLVEVSRDTDGVRWLGVAVQDRRVDSEELVAEYDVWWPTVHDLDATTYTEVGALGMPTTLFFDADGVLVSTVTGALTDERLAAELLALRG